MGIRAGAWFLIVTLMLEAWPTNAQAQPAAEIQPVKITDVRGSLFTETRYRHDQDTLAGRKIRQEDLLFSYGLNLLTQGYLYHPNLVDFTAGVEVSPTLEQIMRDGEQESSEGLLLGYNLSANIFRAKPVSLRLYANQIDRVLDRSFAQRTELERQTQGGELMLRGAFPISVLFENTDSRETSETRIDEEQIAYTRFRITDARDVNWFTQLTYEHQDVDETIRSRSSTGAVGPALDLPQTTDELNLVNRWAFGPGPLKNTLSGQINWRRQTGAFDNEIALVQQSLDLNHSPTFSTFYSARYRSNETADQTDRELSGQIGFRKKVFDSLDILGSIDGLDERFTDGLQQRYGGGLDLDYRKQTPIGRYSSTLSLARHYEREESEAGTRRIIDEPVTLTGIASAPLSGANVLAGSVLVTDQTNVLVYVEGVDYVLRRIGSLTEIARLAGGSINDGQTVLVDYTVSTGRDTRFTTDDLRWRHRLELDPLPLALYLEYQNRLESLREGDDPGNLDHSEVWLLGVELLLNELTLRAEHERRQERLTPSSDTNRFRADYHKNLAQNVSLALSAGYEMIRYHDAEEFGLEEGRDFLDTLTARANATTKVNRDTLLRAGASYLQSRGRVDDMQVRLEASVTWQRGLLSVNLEGYHAIYEQEGDEGVTDFVGIKVRRRF